jgi:citrate synthase
MELEEVALKDQYFIDHNLYPNIDFYQGYCSGHLHTHQYVHCFYCYRKAPGWIAQWKREHGDPDWKIQRPRQVYIGLNERDYIPCLKEKTNN